MLDSVSASGTLRFDVDLAYRDAASIDSLRRVTVQWLDLNGKAASLSGICHSRRAFRQFRVDRIAQLVDPTTGEAPHDFVAWLLERAAGPQNGILPSSEKRQKRPTIISPIQFEEGLAKGWAFGVSDAFKGALDIELGFRLLTSRASIMPQLKARGITADPEGLVKSEAARIIFLEQLIAENVPATRVEIIKEAGQPPKPAVWVEMQGAPPLFEFSVGDIFYSPASKADRPWNEQIQSMRYSIQVTREELGYVQIEVRRYADGRWIETKHCDMDQADLVALLQLGIGTPTHSIMDEDGFKPAPQVGGI